MTDKDDFDAFLAKAFAPRDREEDHVFVARVQQRIRLDDALRTARVAIVKRLAVETAALAAVAAGLAWFAGSDGAAAIAAQSPAPVLAGLIVSFISLVWLLAPPTGQSIGRKTHS